MTELIGGYAYVPPTKCTFDRWELYPSYKVELRKGRDSVGLRIHHAGHWLADSKLEDAVGVYVRMFNGMWIVDARGWDFLTHLGDGFYQVPDELIKDARFLIDRHLTEWNRRYNQTLVGIKSQYGLET